MKLTWPVCETRMPRPVAVLELNHFAPAFRQLDDLFMKASVKRKPRGLARKAGSARRRPGARGVGMVVSSAGMVFGSFLSGVRGLRGRCVAEIVDRSSASILLI